MNAAVQQIDWKKCDNLMPAIIQDNNSRQVLMLGYMNEEALNKTMKTNQVWFYSRSKQRLWMKGETSGNILTVVDMRLDCDQDALLISAGPAGPTCHTNSISCFGDDTIFNLSELEQVIQQRKLQAPQNSYTASLLKAGIDNIGDKVIEEAAELVQAGKQESDQRVIEEMADVLFHSLVLLAERNLALRLVFEELYRRRVK